MASTLAPEEAARSGGRRVAASTSATCDHRAVTETVRVVLEHGARSVFAVALDWPGWARRAKTPDAALATLADYATRYRPVAGKGFPRGRPELQVVGELDGGAMVDFGALAHPGPWDDEPLPAGEADRFAALLERSWAAFDAVAAGAPAELRKGPRGGGRDTAKVVDHVRHAEQGYSAKAGVRLPGSTPWPERRAAVVAAIRAGAPGARWPARYVAQRFTWHVLDHLWEIEDRSE